MTHAHPSVTPTGRLTLATLVVDRGWSRTFVAARVQVCPVAAYAWSRRYRTGEPMLDRPSRPVASVNCTPRRTEYRIIGLCYTRQ